MIVNIIKSVRSVNFCEPFPLQNENLEHVNF